MPTAHNQLPRGGLRGVFDFLHEHRARGLSLAAATVVETAGATYRKPGATMLITAGGTWHGLLSGGCLEGDLAHHAESVLAGDPARVIDYDLEAMTDAVFGFGLGCDGSVRILLERLGPENDWDPLTTLARHASQRRSGCIRRIITSTDPALPVGAWQIMVDSGEKRGDSRLEALCAGSNQTGTPRTVTTESGSSASILTLPIPRMLRLVLLGAAPDAAPVIQVAQTLGWFVTAVDHRAGFVQAQAAMADEALHVPADAVLPRRLLAAADAVVIMSHNLEADARYLMAAVDSASTYIGLLGPSARREALLASANVSASDRSRIFAPVGLDLGGEGPEAIALAVLAEIHQVLHARSGGHRDARSDHLATTTR
jgi:xanthine/CO dehydrogenase XdhC/CoxF family maturation factor